MATNIGSFYSNFDVRPSADGFKAPGGKQAPKKTEDKPAVKDVRETVSNPVKKYAAEDNLSDKAKDLLSKLRDQYGDYGFAVAGSDAEFSSMKGVSDKEYSVIFTADELEKMAEDEDYAAEQMKQVESLIDMSKKLENDEEFQAKLDELAEKGYILQNLSITPNAEGGVDVFAELAKVSEKQAERIEERRAENKAQAKADREASEEEAIAKKFEAAEPPKKGIIKAGSVEELMRMIKGLDDNGLEEIVSKPGGNIDFAV
ncbi:MAG: hypothetical protein IK123_10415 [Lachnospiraceae bacterium]|nr:hypothetical protein [Lachnospiraceae bacterium]